MPPVALGILQIELIHQIILLKCHDALFQQKRLHFKNRHPKTFPLATATVAWKPITMSLFKIFNWSNGKTTYNNHTGGTYGDTNIQYDTEYTCVLQDYGPYSADSMYLAKVSSDNNLYCG